MDTNEIRDRHQERKDRRDQFINEKFNTKSGRRWGGLVLIIIGGVFLAHQAGADIPHWVFSWPMIPLYIGLFIGAKMNFRPDGWLIPVAIGAAFLVNEINPELRIMPYVWPTIIIVVGLFMILRPKKNHGAEYWNNVSNSTEEGDAIETVSVFGGNKKMIITKNFKGGEAVSVFGGTELNLTQADINGVATLELVQVFGGAKLIVPSNWKINSEVVSVFGSLEDKRQLTNEPADNTKVLKLIGTSVFGGVEIKSY